MKCLTITLDDKELFAGEVAEIQWSENAEMVSVVGRFKPAPGFLDTLRQATATATAKQGKAGGQPTIPDGTVPPALKAVRDGDDAE